MNGNMSRGQPITVSQLTQRIKGVLEPSFPAQWVVGEISNFKRAGSGHWYFSLKDEQCQIRCNMWRSYTNRMPFAPADGMEVLAKGSLSVYAPRGDYSLIVEHMEERGAGRLRRELERLKAQLASEGLFAPEHKKPLPLLPRKIGVVTSPTGAAIRDILRVLDHRFQGIEVLIHPARVQGEGAAEEIASGIEFLDLFGECDLLIVGRGGGSEEDLWCFNEERVVRTIFAARTPVIAAVGHEVDVTLSDMVADVRAATPSNAAELAVKTREEYHQIIEIHTKNLQRALQRKVLVLRDRVRVSESHPIFLRVRSLVNAHQRRLIDLENTARRVLVQRLSDVALRLQSARQGLRIDRLEIRATRAHERLALATRDLHRLSDESLNDRGQRAAALIGRLEDLSPLKVLQRGYAAVFGERKQVVRGPEDVRNGEQIEVKLAKGKINARVIDDREQAVQESLF